MDQNYNSLSGVGKKCFTNEKKELDNFSLITEIDMAQARKLADISGKLLSQLEVYTSEKSLPEEKLKALESVKKSYVKLIVYVRNHIKCFEPRKVLIMCENKMILAGINPLNIAEKIKEVELVSEDNESGENNKNSKTNKVNPAMLGS